MPKSLPTPRKSRVASTRIVFLFLTGAGLMAMTFASGSLVLAQAGKKNPGGGSGGTRGMSPPGGGMPGMSPPGAGMPGMAPPGGGTGRGNMGGPMGGGMGGPSKKGGTKKAAPTKREAPETIDNESLPPGYKVPQEPPDALVTTAEWIEDPFNGGDQKVQKSMLNKYRLILEAGDFKDGGERQFVADIMQWKLSMLTRKEKRETADHWRETQIKKDLNGYPKTGNPKTVRKFLLKFVADEAPKLFEFHVIARLNGAILLSELCEINESDAEGGKTPAVPCMKGATPLMEMVKDGKQLTSVRAWGIKGLVRLATLPEAPAQLRSDIVDMLVAQMNSSSQEHKWYQWRLAEGLGRLNVVLNQGKRPYVPQALARVLTDTDRPWLVRAEAAQSLGRLPYDSNIDVGLLAYEIARLAQQMTEAFDKQRELPIWKLCFMKVYGAFKPLEEEDSSKQKRGLLAQVESRPALSSYKKTVQESFDLVLPLVVKVVGEPEGIDVSLVNLKKWLDQNVPKNSKIHPDEDPIISKPNTANRIQDAEPSPPSAQPGAR